LEPDFPRTFVQEYFHWIHRGSSEIEFRHLQDPWHPQEEDWRISTHEDRKINHLALKSTKLIDIDSKTAQAVHGWLCPLERDKHNGNIYYHCDTKEIHVRLPRMNLDFVIRPTGLESKQFRGMIVDINQKVGTLRGLQNKLVLKEYQGAARIVIVPHGTVSFRRDGQHVKVSVNTGLGSKVPYHQFVIDKDLGLLVDNANLRSRLFKLYLHALTSHCLPDSLTGRTGAEEALCGLRSAGTGSFLSLEQEHVEQLRLFAKLTPSRDFFPKDSRYMIQTDWEDISPLSYHEDCVKEATLLLEQAEMFRVFQTASDIKYKVEQRGSIELRGRAAMRNSHLRLHSFGAEGFSVACDAPYIEARDSIIDSPREHEAFYISSLVDTWARQLSPLGNLFKYIEPCRFIRGLRSDFEFGFDK
jgi:hypothetical protein